MQTNFKKLSDEIIDYCWKIKPTNATASGIHKFDNFIEDFSKEGIEKTIKKKKAYLNKLQKFSLKKSKGEYLDKKLLENQLKFDIREWDVEKILYKNPSVYPQTCIYSIYLLLMREYAETEVIAENLINRLSAIPQFFKDAKANLRPNKDIPDIWLQVAAGTAEGGVALLENAFDEFVGYLDKKTENKLYTKRKKAITALEDFTKFIEKKITGKNTKNLACGEDYLQFIINTKHMLPYSCDDILLLGEKLLKKTIRDIEKVAKKIDPNKSWEELIEELKKDHPPKQELIHSYRTKMLEAKKFIREKDIVSIPKNERLHIVYTPEFERPTISHAAIVPPAPFDNIQESFFWITPVEEKASKKAQELKLRDHCFYSIPVIAVHEAFPGHHLQISAASSVKSNVRKFMESEFMNEGWAVYCEEMMQEQGFLKKPEEKLFKLKNQLWRACRVIIDIKLHTGKMTFNEAIKMLIDVSKMGRNTATSDVIRYTLTPGYPLTYLIGKYEILKMRAKYKKSKGKSYKLKEFHDELLSFGSIPFSVIEEGMGL
ncbi:MAG: DUF885 domain-containing protein [Pseudomonadota bacterium]